MMTIVVGAGDEEGDDKEEDRCVFEIGLGVVGDTAADDGGGKILVVEVRATCDVARLPLAVGAGTMFPTFGHSARAPFPARNRPINVLGS